MIVMYLFQSDSFYTLPPLTECKMSLLNIHSTKLNIKGNVGMLILK